MSIEKELKKNLEENTKLFRPKVDMDLDYNTFSVNWGHKKTNHSVETKTKEGYDVIFDISKEGEVIGVEVMF